MTGGWFRAMRVYEVNDLYVDGEGRKAVTGFFVAADTLSEAVQKAATLSLRIQINSRATMFQQRLMLDGEASRYRGEPEGTVRRRLHVIMSASGSGSPSDHMFAIFVFDPNPDMLDASGNEVNFQSPAWVDFETSVLRELVDIHGHLMENVIAAYIEQS